MNKLIEDVFVTEETGKPYLRYETGEEGVIEFATIRGGGLKLHKKNDYKSYKVSMIISKKEAKHLRKVIQALWDEFRPRDSEAIPENMAGLVYEHDNGNFYINPHARAVMNDKETVIGIVDCDGNKLDPEVFSKIGKGSTAYLSVNLTTYAEGVSMYLNAVQLIDFVPYAGGSGDGSGNFTKKDGKALGSGDNDFSKKKKKKKH